MLITKSYHDYIKLPNFYLCFNIDFLLKSLLCYFTLLFDIRYKIMQNSEKDSTKFYKSIKLRIERKLNFHKMPILDSVLYKEYGLFYYFIIIRQCRSPPLLNVF